MNGNLCVMECYFREHKAERDLLFHDSVAKILEETHTKARSHEEGKNSKDSSASCSLLATASPCETSSPEFLRGFVASCENSPPRPSSSSTDHGQAARATFTADSPDLLAVIKQEGKV